MKEIIVTYLTDMQLVNTIIDGNFLIFVSVLIDDY